ncbi:MAG: FHA domain-containing protein [Actinomycetia bacterium]|nr:FHA domain-containing protein [Actinomycetes bacterium]
MAELLVTLLKVGFLAVLWVFVLLVANTIRNDLVARPALATAGAARRSEAAAERPAQPEPRILAIQTGSQAGARLALVEHFRIGRSADCALILDDDYVSGDHAEMQHRANGDWVLTDLGSTNGSFVNGVRVTTPTVVTPADDIRIGRTQMRLEP